MGVPPAPGFRHPPRKSLVGWLVVLVEQSCSEVSPLSLGEYLARTSIRMTMTMTRCILIPDRPVEKRRVVSAATVELSDPPWINIMRLRSLSIPPQTFSTVRSLVHLFNKFSAASTEYLRLWGAFHVLDLMSLFPRRRFAKQPPL